MKKFKKFKELSKKTKIITISVLSIVVVAGLAFGIPKAIATFGAKKATATTTVKAVKDSIEVAISGSGTIQPISRYDIIPLVKGTILESKFEVGSTVKKGDVLYRFDSTDLQSNIQKTRNGLSRTEITAQTNNDSIRNLRVTAPSNGTLTNFTLKQGEQVSNGKVADVINSDNLIARVPFNSAQLEQINVGDSATITSAQYMTTIEGTVTYKTNAATAAGDGSALYNVEIQINNPGALASGLSVGATVHTNSGSITSPSSGTTENSSQTPVLPESTGKVSKIYAKNNQHVNKGDLLFEIQNDSLIQNRDKTNLDVKDSALSLQSLQKQLDDYNITSPIDGVVITKTSKAGDTINSGTSASTVLMVVADLSKMVFTMDIDELDISKVQLGLKADITADALPNEKYVGEVTEIASEGVSANGVTTYKVKITINEPKNLRPAMNVNANIVVNKKDDVIVVPISVVNNLKNNSGMVFVKGAMTGAPNGDRPTNAGNSQPTDKTATQNPTSTGAPQGNRTQGGTRKSSSASQIPAGFRPQRVETGLANSENIEIISGLNEGDEVLVPATATTKTSTTAAPSFGGGGIPGAGGGFSGGNRNAGGR